MERLGAGWVNRELLVTGLAIRTFGEDEAGEIYIGAEDGTILHLVGGTAPRLNSTAVTNAASYVTGLSPGSLATAFASGVLDSPGVLGADRIPLPLSLQGVSITVDGIAAPILSLSNVNGREQINFQVPFEISKRTSASVVAARAGASSGAVVIPVFEIQPAVYTSDGTRAIVLHNADFSFANAGRPLVPGESAAVYAAGLGPVANQPPNGAAASSSPLPATLNPVALTLAGLPCEVQFAGLAPGFVGVYQVNFRVPANAPRGSQDMVLTAGAGTKQGENPGLGVTLKAPLLCLLIRVHRRSSAAKIFLRSSHPMPQHKIGRR